MRKIQLILLVLTMIGAVACQKEVDYAIPGGDNNNPGGPMPMRPTTQGKQVIKFIKK